MVGENKWSGISAIVGILALIVTLFPLIIGRDTKQLSVETVTTAKLVDLSDPALSTLKLSYKDVEVSKLSVTTIEIRNSGSRPIERTDFEEPLLLRFRNTGDVLAATITKNNPEYLSPIITSDGTLVSIAPLLLNPDDTFRLSIQLRGEINEPRVEARISGTTISRTTYPADTKTWYGIVVIIAATAVTFLYFYMAPAAALAILAPQRFVFLSRAEAIFLLLTLLTGSVTLCAAAIKIFDPTKPQRVAAGILVMFIGSILALIAKRRLRRLLLTSRS
jgi:hypothetical protein